MYEYKVRVLCMYTNPTPIHGSVQNSLLTGAWEHRIIELLHTSTAYLLNNKYEHIYIYNFLFLYVYLYTYM